MNRVLIASINTNAVYEYSKVLKDYNFTIDSVNSLQEIREKDNIKDYDLIIISGDLKECLFTIQCIRMNTYAVIVVYSPEIDTKLVIELFKAGADEFFIKFKMPEILVAKMDSLVRRRINERQKTMAVGQFRFDFEKEQIFFKNQCLEITHREYLIMLYLFKNRQRIVSKEELYRMVWNKELPKDRSAFWTAMSRLNKKMKKFENDFCIDSNHEGYQLYIRCLTE